MMEGCTDVSPASGDMRLLDDLMTAPFNNIDYIVENSELKERVTERDKKITELENQISVLNLDRLAFAGQRSSLFTRQQELQTKIELLEARIKELEHCVLQWKMFSDTQSAELAQQQRNVALKDSQIAHLHEQIYSNINNGLFK